MQFSNLLVVFNLFVLFTGAEVPPQVCWTAKESEEPYFIGNGFTCCNNTYLEHPLQPKNEHWRKCLSKQHGNPDDDLPMTLWKAYSCELYSAGTFSEGQPTYKEFEAFFMKNYPDDLKKRLLDKDINCEVPEGIESGDMLKRFEDCFWKAEEQICLEMAGTVALIETNEANNSVCEPVELLKNPNHSFMTFARPCCKGQQLPYPLFDVFMDFDRFEITEEVVTCAEKLKSRLKELSPQSPVSFEEPLTMCQVACVHEADGFGGKYDANFQNLMNFKLKSVSNSVRTIVMEKIAKFNPQFKLWGSNKTVPMDQAGDIISTQDEVSQIMNYCKFHFEATAEAYRALYEYCYNEQYGIQFREDILKVSNTLE